MRRFTTAGRVHLGDCSPGGRLRIDAALRMMQDIADDDVADAGLTDAKGSVVRRTVLHIAQFPTYLEPIIVATWCSGFGGRWAERSTVIEGSRGGHVEAATIWVHIDPVTFRPLPLSDQFVELYAESAQGRKVSTRLRHEDPPSLGEHSGCSQISWPLRFSDFDVMGHVNNAAAAEIVEELLAEQRDLRAPLTVELEYRRELPRAAAADVRHRSVHDVAGGDELCAWIMAPTGSDDVLQSITVARWEP